MCRRALAVQMIVAAVAVGVAAGPAAAGPLRAVVQFTGEADAELVLRIRGQTVDLDLDLIAVRGDVSDQLPVQLAAARELSRTHGARVVLWFRPLGDAGLIVYVAEPARDTVFVRRVPQPERGLTARSATVESAALVVRSALRALAAGGHIGVTTAAATAAGPDGPLPAPPRPPPQWHIAVGWLAAADGTSAAGHHGLDARVGLGSRRWYGAVALTALPEVSLVDELTDIRIARYGAVASLGYRPWPTTAMTGRRHDLVVEIGAGAQVYARSTLALSADVAATPPSRAVAITLGPAVRYRRAVGGRGLYLELYAAADAVLRAPEYGYEIAGAFVSRAQIRQVQPRLGAGLVLQSF